LPWVVGEYLASFPDESTLYGSAEIFDDLFIGNVMKTTLSGRMARRGLYPSVNPYLGTWAGTGRAETKPEVPAYFAECCKRAPLPNLLGRFDDRAEDAVLAHVPMESPAFQILRPDPPSGPRVSSHLGD
jgi:hypothetical protein